MIISFGGLIVLCIGIGIFYAIVNPNHRAVTGRNLGEDPPGPRSWETVGVEFLVPGDRYWSRSTNPVGDLRWLQGRIAMGLPVTIPGGPTLSASHITGYRACTVAPN